MIQSRRDLLQRYQKDLRQLAPVVASIQRQLKAVDNYLEEYINEET